MFWENIKEAITSIFSNKMRSVLTMLGIIIGISSVITITTIGSSIRSTLSSTLNSLGGSSIMCYVEAYYPDTDEDWETWIYPDMDAEDYVSQEMIDELCELYPDEVYGVSISNYVGSAKLIKDSEHYANVEVTASSAGYTEEMKLKMLKGRDISRSDFSKGKNTCVISDVMAKNYFEDDNPLGQIVSVDCENGISFEAVVVGVYEYNTAVFGKPNTSIPEKDRSTTLFMNYSYVSKAQGNEMKGYDYFSLTVNPQTEDQEELCSRVRMFFDEKYAENDDWHVDCRSIASELGMIDTVINVITVAISLIAAISLIVGGVGVMNIMLVSITERTKEIGIRMALGAKPKTIRMQFLIEAVVLCLIGGVIGILIGILNGALLGQVAEAMIQSYYSDMADYIILSVRPSVNAILLSLFFSMLIGIFFGHYPAKKASQMEVIDALRYE